MTTPTRTTTRWDADQMVTNHFGDRVWLRELYDDAGKRIGITDCCFAKNPCRWHAALAVATKGGSR